MAFSQVASAPVVDISQPVTNDVADTHRDDDTFDDIFAAHDQEMESATESDATPEQRNDLDEATWVFVDDATRVKCSSPMCP